MRFITKFLSNYKFKRFSILVLLFALYIFVSAVSYTNAVCSNISDSVFRLHVIANSDSLADQDLKYAVRDSVINYINSLCKDVTSKDEIISIAKNNIQEIEKIALQTIHNNGYNYSVKINIGNFAFPSKNYGDITLPPRIL